VVKTANALPAGKLIKCPRCAKIFAAFASATSVAQPAARTATAKETKLAAAAKETKIAAPQVKTTQLATGAAKETKIAAQAKATKLAAAQVKQTKVASAQSKETKLAPPAAPRPTPGTPPSANGGARAAPFQITCPSCRATATWKAASPPPIGKRIKCPRCAALYVVPAPKAQTPAPAAAKPPTKAPAPKPATVTAKAGENQRIVRYACPGCKAVLKTATPLPAGKAIKCPRCQRTFAISGKKPPAPRTQSARDTKLLPPSPRAPAKPTTLAPSSGKAGAVKRPVGRMPCPACKAILKFVGLPPADKPLKCPKCAKSFQVRVKKTAKPTRQPAVPTSQIQTKEAPPRSGPTAGTRAQKTDPAPPPAAATVPAAAPRSRQRLPWFIGLLVLASLSVGLYTWLAGHWTHEIPESAWVEFTPPDGRCRVLMPGVPDAEAATVNVPGLVKAQKFTVLGSTSFMLICSEHSATVTGKESFNKLYSLLRDDIIGNLKVKGSLTHEMDLTLNGALGREFQVALPEGGLMVSRVYLIRGQSHDRLYVLVAGGKYFRAGEGDAAKFFSSFKLDSAAGPVNHPREKRGRIRTADRREAPQPWLG
jgi:hypothetical protein